MDPATASAIGSVTSKAIGTAADLIFGGDDTPLDAGDYAQAARATIRGKVEGARAAGISPLYALGAPTISPVASVGGGPSLGENLASMGQDVSRALAAGQSDAERILQTLTLEKAGLENEYLRDQIASLRARTLRDSVPPAIASQPGLIPEKVSPPDRMSGLNLFGIPWESAPWQSDSQSVTNRYGESEILETLNAIGIGAQDYYWNVYSPSNPGSSLSRVWNWAFGK